jgi:plastocyanin
MVGLAGEATAGKKTVKLGDNFFAPPSLTVKKGTLVRFKWIGENDHNVVKKKGPGKSSASTTTDAPGIHFKKRFKKTGNYKLICTIHEKMKMGLSVVG